MTECPNTGQMVWTGQEMGSGTGAQGTVVAFHCSACSSMHRLRASEATLEVISPGRFDRSEPLAGSSA